MQTQQLEKEQMESTLAPADYSFKSLREAEYYSDFVTNRRCTSSSSNSSRP